VCNLLHPGNNQGAVILNLDGFALLDRGFGLLFGSRGQFFCIKLFNNSGLVKLILRCGAGNFTGASREFHQREQGISPAGAGNLPSDRALA